MKRMSALTIVAIFALGAAAQSAHGAEDPHAGHAMQGGPGPQPGMGGPQGGPPPQPGMEGHGGGMHDMMRQHMDMMRDHGKREHESYADVVLKFAGELKLSDAQIGKITRLHQANRQKMDELGPKMRESLKATHETFLNPAADEATIRKVAKEHSSVFDQLLETNLKARAEINAVLTTEQLKMLQSQKVL